MLRSFQLDCAINIGYEEREAIFGHYASNSIDFQFQDKEKEIIFQVVNFLREILTTDNHLTTYLSENVYIEAISRAEVQKTAIGLIFSTVSTKLSKPDNLLAERVVRGGLNYTHINKQCRNYSINKMPQVLNYEFPGCDDSKNTAHQSQSSLGNEKEFLEVNQKQLLFLYSVFKMKLLNKCRVYLKKQDIPIHIGELSIDIVFINFQTSEAINKDHSFWRKILKATELTENIVFQISDIYGTIKCKCGSSLRCSYCHQNSFNLSEKLIKTLNRTATKNLDVVIVENHIKGYFRIQNFQSHLETHFRENDSINNIKPDNSVPALYKNPDLLKLLLISAANREGKNKNGYRYPTSIKHYSVYSYIAGGKWHYEINSKNLPLPSVSTVTKYIQKYSPNIIEGEFRGTALLKYLKKFNLAKTVWLSEDATGIEARYEYDPKTNQIIGLSLPLDEESGLPQCYSYLARNEDEIKRHVNNRNRAKLIYVIMAQPMSENCPPFPLLLFGTNNKFNTTDVLNRWKFITQELKKIGIEVLGISSDADTRLLSAMRHQTKIGTQDKMDVILDNHLEIFYEPYFNAVPTELLFIQDPIHNVTKLRNRLLNSAICIPMGNRYVTVSHLEILLNSVPKSVHKLTKTDINPDDRQNFKSAEKTMELHVLKTLEENVLDSEATVQYLSLSRDILYPLTDPAMDTSERIFVYWRALFFLRLWRNWIKENHNVKENFLTNETYACLEINGHSLIQLVIKLHKEDRPEMFLPIIFNSQTCEKTFRTIRSMTTMFWTRINGSVADVLHLFDRLEILNNLIYLKLPEDGISVTRINKPPKMKLSPLPDVDQIKLILKQAKDHATKIAEKFGIPTNNETAYYCNLNIMKTITKKQKSNVDIQPNEHYSNNIAETATDHIDETSPFVAITNHKGQKEIVRKSSLICYLTDNTKKLSNDRVRRVQESCLEKYNNKTKEIQKPTCSQRSTRSSTRKFNSEKNIIYKSNRIDIGDWCFFKKKSIPVCKASSNKKNAKDTSNFLLGCIIAFKYTDVTSAKQSKFINKYAIIGQENQAVDTHSNTDEINKTVVVLAKWYSYNVNGQLSETSNKNGKNEIAFISLRNYIVTLKGQPEKSAENSNELKLILNKGEIDFLMSS